MAGEGLERNQSLRDALLESLTAILSPMQDVRAAGEEQIKALEVTEEFGLHLAELTVDPNGGMAIRQLASVLLKQYVEVHWSEHSEKFRPPETSEPAKAAIRQILPMGLKETISKVRSSVAYAVSAIAHWDWPEQWPQLFGILMEALTSGNHEAVHGAMRVLTEFCQQVTDNQMPQVAPVILPEMYKIFTQDQVYSIRTRGRAVDIFNNCAGLIAAMNEMQKGTAKQLLFPVVPQFTEAFVHALQTPDGWTMDSGLKMEVLKGLTTLVKFFPGQMSQWITQILPPVWNTLTHSADIYIRTVVNNTEEADDPVDSDGEVLGFENLVYSVFEFIHGLIDTAKFRTHVKKSADQLFYYILLYAQITEDQERQWLNNPDQFVEDEDEDSFSYSVRISAQDLLLLMCNEFPKDAAPGLIRAVDQHLQQADVLRNSGNQHWWKLHESVMLALGSVSSLIIDKVSKNKMQFDLNGFLTTVVLNDLNSSASPFLLGRCLWTASRFTEVMSPQLIQSLLEATVKGLEVTQSSVVRISAVRAVFGFSTELKAGEKTAIIMPFLPSIMEGLIAVATQFSSEVLALCLETMTVVLGVDDQFTASVEPKVTPLVSAILLRYSRDPLLISLTQDIFKVLCENKMCNHAVQQRVNPTLVSILQAPADKIAVGLHAMALDILQTVVRGCDAPLSDALINNAFPACVQCTLATDDNSTLQNGGECLRAYVSVSLEQVCQWHDGQGNNGLYYIVQVISKLLDPKTSEFSATFVGRLVSMLISKMGSQLGENLDLMLRAVLSKMQQAETPSVIQSLVMIFAHLIHTQMDAVLEFLSSVPGPTGKPALEFVLIEWCSCQHLFFGYEGKVSAIALSKLMLHAVQTNDSRLQGIEVKGDQVFQPLEGIRTRSKASKAPDQWTMVPVLVKIYKLLINELSSQLEMQAAGEDDEEGEWEDIEEEEVEEQKGGGGGDSIQELMSALSSSQDFLGYEREEDEEEDPDALADPLYKVNLQGHLTEFLQSFSRQPCYGMFSSHHSAEEKQVLQQIGINA